MHMELQIGLFIGIWAPTRSDWNGDSIVDYCVVGGKHDHENTRRWSSIDVLSGSDSDVLATIELKWPVVGAGRPKCEIFADIDGDGSRDLLIYGTWSPMDYDIGKGEGLYFVSSLLVISGANGALLSWLIGPGTCGEGSVPWDGRPVEVVLPGSLDATRLLLTHNEGVRLWSPSPGAVEAIEDLSEVFSVPSTSSITAIATAPKECHAVIVGVTSCNPNSYPEILRVAKDGTVDSRLTMRGVAEPECEIEFIHVIGRDASNNDLFVVGVRSIEYALLRSSMRLCTLAFEGERLAVVGDAFECSAFYVSAGTVDDVNGDALADIVLMDSAWEVDSIEVGRVVLISGLDGRQIASIEGRPGDPLRAKKAWRAETSTVARPTISVLAKGLGSNDDVVKTLSVVDGAFVVAR